MKILFHVEGFTDIRFVRGLSELGDVTLAVPERTFAASGLKARIEAERLSLHIDEIPGGRLRFQWNSFKYLWRQARRFDVILSQEVLRGSLNATVVGKLKRVPVVTYMGIAPVEYFRCRRERKQISWLASILGVSAIRTLMTINGRLATRCLAMGPYLRDVALKYCPRSEIGLYYGVDTNLFCPVTAAQRSALRKKLELPESAFLVIFSSRMSHEKDPETVLLGCAKARELGVPVSVINLGGGFEAFLALAKELNIPDYGEWVLGRNAVNPLHGVHEYFQSGDAIVLASLAEGAAYSTLEGLSCATPTVVSEVGGMAVQLAGYARFFPRRDSEGLGQELQKVYQDWGTARKQAERGRQHIEQEWNRRIAFERLGQVFREVTSGLQNKSPLPQQEFLNQGK